MPDSAAVDLAVRLAALSKAEFHALNPQMNKPVILAAGVPQILLPYDNAKLFLNIPQVFAGLVTIAILGMVFEFVFGVLERRTIVRWGMKTST